GCSLLLRRDGGRRERALGAGLAVPRRPSKAGRAPRAEKAKKLEKAADAFSSFRPASEAMTEVLAVPTVFCQLDHATGVGGWPVERFTLIHGPSGGGKTKALIGLFLSFLLQGHYAYFLDP